MATVKLFEVRDRGTCIPTIAIRLDDNTEQEARLAQRAGYGSALYQPNYVLVAALRGGEPLHYDPCAWATRARTMPTAHRYIVEHFADLAPGAVVDVRWILGETPAPAESDCADPAPEI